jgi:hypothetical protein
MTALVAWLWAAGALGMPHVAWLGVGALVLLEKFLGNFKKWPRVNSALDGLGVALEFLLMPVLPVKVLTVLRLLKVLPEPKPVPLFPAERTPTPVTKPESKP